MGSSNSHLVVLDFPRIKQFVFGTDRLVEIRGASALLDRLNRNLIPQWILQRFGPSSRCVFAGGGAAQFVIADQAEKIREVFHEIQGEIHRQSGGELRITTGIGSLKDGYRTALERAFLDLEVNKVQSAFASRSTLHTGFVRECMSCSSIAQEVTEFGGETRILCQSCANKQKVGRERGLWEEVSKHWKGRGMDPDQLWNWRPKDFEEIGDRCRTRQGYTALIYADGNSMGRIVKDIPNEKRFELFSRAVDNAVRDACYEALWRHCQPVEGKIPADILLLGGDDLMVYLAADAALPFAIDVAHLFEEEVRKELLSGDPDPFFEKRLGNKGLTLSIGIAYGQSHTPISVMVDQAEELLKSAKKEGSSLVSQGSYTPTCIDFHLTSHFNQARVLDSRSCHLTLKTSRGEEIRLYHGPYTLEEAEALLEHAGHLKASGIPRTRLHRLAEAPFKGKVNGTIETLTIYSRCRSSEQKQAIWNALDRFDCLPLMPWKKDENKIGTVLVDLVEIAEFIQSKEEAANHASSHPD